MKIFILLIITVSLIILILRKQELFQDTVFKMDNISVKGSDGLRGPPGPRGPKGDKGATGPRGLTGPRGIMGPKGNAGAVSPKFSSITIGSFTISDNGGKLFIRKRGVNSGLMIGMHNPKNAYGANKNGLFLAPEIQNTGSIGTHMHEFDDMFVHNHGRHRRTKGWTYD